MPTIPRLPFGRTGHQSTRIIFGAAAFFAMRQDRADKILQLLLDYGINHIDVAASYGEAELRVGGWMSRHREHFFIASKTGDRTAQGALKSVQRSLERLRIERLDLIQLHNLTDENDWQTAMGPGGALEGVLAARDQGLVRFIGVTGHGTQAPHMHLRSLEQFAFDAVLLPYNYMMMQDATYAAAFENLRTFCMNRQIALQTIKAIARRRWPEGNSEPHFSWYQPIQDADALRRTVQWVLQTPGAFLNTTSDARLLPRILEAAAQFDKNGPAVNSAQMATDAAALDMAPLFAEGLPDPF